MILRLTVDCTIEQSINSTATVLVDSGTQQGIHVPVGDFRNMFVEMRNAQHEHTKAWR